MIKFLSLIALISIYYSSLCQDTLFVGDYYTGAEGNDLKHNYRSLNLYTLNDTLIKELKDLVCNCKQPLNDKKIQGFSIVNLKWKETSLTLITPFTNWDLDNPSINGVTFIDEVPFLITDNYDFEEFLQFEENQVTFKYSLNTNHLQNLILSNLYDNSHPMEKYFILNDTKFKFIIDYCTKRSNRNGWNTYQRSGR